MTTDTPNQLDATVLEQLRQLDAVRPGTLAEIIRRFAEDGDQRIRTIEDAGAAKLDVVAAEAHSLKGSGGTIGATEVARLSAHIEQAARAGAWTPDEVGQLRAAFTRALAALQAVIAAS